MAVPPPHSADEEGWATIPPAHLPQLSHGCERQAARTMVTSDVPERRRRVLGSVSRVPFTHTPCHPQTFPEAMAGAPRLTCRLQRWACQRITAKNVVPCFLQGNSPPAVLMVATLPAYVATSELTITHISSEGGCVKDLKAHREDPFQHPTSTARGTARRGLCPQHFQSFPKSSPGKGKPCCSLTAQKTGHLGRKFNPNHPLSDQPQSLYQPN